MSSAVDAVSAPGDNGDATGGELRRQLHRDVIAVPGRCARAHDGDRRLEAPKRRHVTAHPEAQRRVRTEVVQLGRPIGVRRGDERDPAGGGGGQRFGDRTRGEPRQPAFAAFRQFAARELGGVAFEHRLECAHGTARGDEATRRRIAGLDELAPDRRGVPVTSCFGVILDPGRRERATGGVGAEIEPGHSSIPFLR